MDDTVRIAMSSVADGSMSKAVSETVRDKNRRKFLEKQGMAPEKTILVHLQYGGDNYRRYYTVGLNEAGEGMTRLSSIVTDGLFTREKQLALFLPVADCVGMIVYDTVNQVLGLAHLGRHNLLQQGGSETMRYMKDNFGTDARGVRIWLSAAAGGSNYPLHDFDGRSMHDVTLEQLRLAGIQRENITIDTRDTTTDQGLFSHSEFLRGNRDTDGRQAVVTMMY